MGRYTQLTMTYYLKAATPPEVLAVHKYLLGDDGGFPDPFPGPLPEHPLFQCDRWDSIGRGGGEYPGPFRAFTPAFREGWEVGFSCSFKDYDDEIRHWLDWIGPWVEISRRAIGWYASDDTEWASIIWAMHDPEGKLVVSHVNTPPDADDLRWEQR